VSPESEYPQQDRHDPYPRFVPPIFYHDFCAIFLFHHVLLHNSGDIILNYFELSIVSPELSNCVMPSHEKVTKTQAHKRKVKYISMSKTGSMLVDPVLKTKFSLSCFTCPLSDSWNLFLFFYKPGYRDGGFIPLPEIPRRCHPKRGSVPVYSVYSVPVYSFLADITIYFNIIHNQICQFIKIFQCC